jgi:hypothetical protein
LVRGNLYFTKEIYIKNLIEIDKNKSKMLAKMPDALDKTTAS